MDQVISSSPCLELGQQRATIAQTLVFALAAEGKVSRQRKDLTALAPLAEKFMVKARGFPLSGSLISTP